MLRYSLQSGQQETVPFEEELRLAEDYLALEQIRHENRLRVRWEITPEARPLGVPPMILQTLVENAVKYGISPRREGGEIAISARCEGATLAIRVTNPGDLSAPASAAAARAGSSTGVGLRNAAERLRLLFGPAATLTLRPQPAGHVTAAVSIPPPARPRPMKALLIDDERLARNELRRLLAAHADIEIAGEAVDAEDARAKVAALRPDLLFLDVQMPGADGFSLLEQVEAPLPLVIFTTAYDEFAVKAFEFNALDYLLKPVDPHRLDAALEKLRGRASPPPLAPGGGGTGRLTMEDKVFVREGDRCWFVPVKNLRLLESEGNYTRLHFDDQKPQLFRSLTAIEERLDPKHFFRANRKQVINLAWVDGIEPWFSGGLLVKLKGGMQVELSRRQAQDFRDRMSL